MKPRILVIDDEPAIRDSLRMIIEYEGYEFIGAPAGPEGIALAERESPDLVFLDIKMPGMDGFEALGPDQGGVRRAGRHDLRARYRGDWRRGGAAWALPTSSTSRPIPTGSW